MALAITILFSSFVIIPRYIEGVKQEQKATSQQLFQDASDHFSRGEYQQALDLISQAIQLTPNEVNNYLLRIKINFELQSFDRIIQDYDVLIRMSPRSPEYYAGRGAAYLQLEQSFEALLDYNKAYLFSKDEDIITIRNQLLATLMDTLTLEQINDMLAAEPDSQDLLRTRAIHYYQNENYQEALNDFLLLDNHQQSYELLTLIAQCYYNTAQYEKAYQTYDKAFTLDNSDKSLLIHQAGSLVLLGNPQKAAPIYQEYLKYYPNDSTALSALIDILIAQEDYALATTYMNQLVAINPNKTDLYYQLGYLSYLNKDYINAANHYLRYFQLSNNTKVLPAIATAYHLGNDLANALTYYSLAIDSDVEKISSSYQRGSIYMEQKKYRDAIADFKVAYDAGYNKDYAIYNQGIAYMQLSDFKSSTRCFKEVVAISSNQDLIDQAKKILSRYYVE